MLRKAVGHIFSHRDLLFSVICGLLLLINRVTVWFGEPPAWFDVLLAGSYFFGGYYTAIEVYKSLRKGKFNIHLLMLIAALGAAFIGAYAEGALLLFLFSLGHALEHLAMSRAKQAINALSEFAPDIARIIKDGQTTEVPVEDLEPGDHVLVRPGERFPADGFVIEGSSSVDQAPITGESIPVDKSPVTDWQDRDLSGVMEQAAHRIFAGTVNGDSVLTIRVMRRASESTLEKVVRLIQEAEKQKSPTQLFAIRFERWFVPLVLGFVTLISFAFLVIDEPFSDSFYRAMTVLVGASPCALAISTPSAILSGIARAARLGILVKGGQPLELLGLVQAVALDKTGTLTEGRPVITDIKPLNGISEEVLLELAAVVESNSDHPLARAVVGEARSRSIKVDAAVSASGTTIIKGKGIRAMVNGDEVSVGKPEMFDGRIPDMSMQMVQELQQNGRTTILVFRGDECLGMIGLMDRPRAESKAALQKLKSLGISPLVMLTGDHQLIADTIGREVGTDLARGDMLPGGKMEHVRKLVEEYGHVAMVGDGVNDGPALAGATVGIAMGAAGSDVALETADIALMADDLNKLPTAVSLSRATRKIIKQNIYISLGMIAFLVPAALFGYATMGIAVLLHEGSTLAVVLNALRLLGWNENF